MTSYDPRNELEVKQLEKIGKFQYMAAPLEPPCRIHKTLKLAHLSRPYGVFATQPIRAGESYQYTGTLIHSQNASPTADTTYVFRLSKTKELDALNIGNALRFVNHSFYSFNMAPQKDPESGSVAYIAIQDIEIGDQLLISYGVDYYSVDDHIILHPTDGFERYEDMIKKHHLQLQKLHLKIKNESVSGEYYCNSLFLALFINQNLKLALHHFSRASLFLPILKTHRGICLPTNQQPLLTSLMIASAQGKTKIVRMLLKQATIHAVTILDMLDNERNSALAHALIHQNKKCTSLLIKAWENKISQFSKNTHAYCREKLIERTQQFMTIRNHDGHSILDLAILHHADARTFKRLIKIFNRLNLSPYDYLRKDTKIKRLLHQRRLTTMIFKACFCFSTLLLAIKLTHLTHVYVLNP